MNTDEIYHSLTLIFSERDLLLLHFLATSYMMGLISFVQIVHYPLFKQVGSEAHLAYHRAHVYWTTWAVGPAMITEALSTSLLCLSPTLPMELTYSGGLILTIIWLSTATLQVPCHNRLSKGFNSAVHTRLVQSNWIRSVGWFLRALIALSLLRGH